MPARRRSPSARRAVTLVFTMTMLVVLLGMAALAIDVGYMVLARTQLQVAADAAALAGSAQMGRSPAEVLAAARQYAGYHRAAGRQVELLDTDVEFGTWDAAARLFTPTPTLGNAVRVTARRDAAHGGAPGLFFGRVLNRFEFSSRASAVAMGNPRDIAFVVDLSGSMNDDAEPCWATDQIDKAFNPQGYGSIGTTLMQQLFDDLGFGAFPGATVWVGEKWGVAKNKFAYAELTKNGGPLTLASVPAAYRIAATDTEAVRKRKAYAAIIDLQIAAAMPAARPAPNSGANYAYWEKYLDYLIEPASVASAPSRGTLPPNQDSDRITGFNNPNKNTFPTAPSTGPQKCRNQIGYVTYAQFMLDHGRDLKPDGTNYVPTSPNSPLCPWHAESTPGGTFSFPPRVQPVHASRRALIAALEVVRQRNAGVESSQADWVSVVTYDTLTGGGPVVRQSLTADYHQAMEACTQFDSVGDKAASTATETGLIVARKHIAPASEGGRGRENTNKVVVLLTDGVPNLFSSSPSEIGQFIHDNPKSEFYSNGAWWYDAALMQSMQMQLKRWAVFPVGLGLGADYDFMDRLSRLGGTADENGQGARGTGNPAEYEDRLTAIFKKIILNPKVRLVQ